MTDITNDIDGTGEGYAARGNVLERIRKLLEHADLTSGDEAEAFIQRAQALMFKHQVDETKVRTTGEKQDEITQITVEHRGIYGDSKRNLTHQIALANGCKTVQWESARYVPVSGAPHKEKKEKIFVLEVTGWSCDLDNLKILDASVQIQATRALKRWERDEGSFFESKSNWDKFRDRREFLVFFCSGLRERLLAARQEAGNAVARQRAAQTGESVSEESRGVALALRDRKDAVNDWFDKRYGNTLRSVRSRTRARGGHSAAMNGYTAGSTTDIGQTRVGGGKRALPQGQ